MKFSLNKSEEAVMRLSQYICTILIFGTISLAFVGCTNVNVVNSVKLYDQQKLSDYQIVKISVYKNKRSFSDTLFNFHPSSIFIEAVDEKEILNTNADGGSYIIPEEVLVEPGKHKVCVRDLASSR